MGRPTLTSTGLGVKSVEPDGPLGNTIGVLQKRKKNQEKLGSSLSINLGMVYLDNLVKDIRVSNQVQRREATGQGKSGSTDSQAEFIHSRASGQPHTKGL